MFAKLKALWARFKAWCKDSETIFWARFQVFVGIALNIAPLLDPTSLLDQTVPLKVRLFYSDNTKDELLGSFNDPLEVTIKQVANRLLDTSLVPILTVLEPEPGAQGILPARRPHVRDARFTLLVRGARDETHFLRVANTGRAGQLVNHPAGEL